MRDSLKPGLERIETRLVERDHTIGFLGESMRVYSTPAMVSDVEYACFRLICEHLDENESSLGVHVSMDHLNATPLGESLQVRVRVDALEGRKVYLVAEVNDGLDLVGRGRHVRVIIDRKRYEERLAQRRGQYQNS